MGKVHHLDRQGQIPGKSITQAADFLRGDQKQTINRDPAKLAIEMIQRPLKLQCQAFNHAIHIAFQMGLIGVAELRRLAQPLLKSGYGQYLERIVREHEALNRAAASAA